MTEGIEGKETMRDDATAINDTGSRRTNTKK